MEKGTELIRAECGELNVMYKGRTLYSRYAPSASAERAAVRAEILENCIYVIPSPLLEYGISSLMEQIPSSSAVLALETDEDLAGLAFESAGKREGYTRVLAVDTPSLYKVFSALQKGQYRRLCLVPLNGGYSVNKERYDALYATLQHFMKNYWQNRLTTAHMGGLWIRNLCSNLNRLDGPDMADFRTGLPVVLCGAGESLEETLPLLSRMREKFYLLAVDTAVQSLMRSGLLPDGIVNLEAQFYNLKDFYSVSKSPVDLFSDITAYPGSLRFPEHRHYFFSSSYGETKLQSRIRKAGLMPFEIPPLGSVGVAALYIASQISDAPLFFTGLDFAYIQGKTHARETPFHDLTALKSNRLIGDYWYSFSIGRKAYSVESKSPGAVSNSILESYGRQLEDLCRSLNRPVYDLGSKGLKMAIPLMNHDQFRVFLTDSVFYKEDRPSGIDDINGETRERTAEALIRDEKKRLENILRLWDRISLEERKEEELLPLLRDCDYLYYHFPDRETLPSTDHAFLFRVITEVRDLLRRLSTRTA